ncbi:uncharacterized protein LOC125959284 [Anopheles darlingi]|uniref:uncharacterized protein LOC125959284 n=1 Tax=Anopheles darlingi TaxID=43151 RepID=UPI00210055EE|nr:uncharacterized protein LOC125959284 [Anopheles darlingi]
MLCRRMRLTERHLQPPREPLEGPIVRPCTVRKLMNLEPARSAGGAGVGDPSTTNNAIPPTTITIPTGDHTTGPGCFEEQPRGRKPPDGPKTPLMIVNLNIPPGTETLAPKSASRTERTKLPHFCLQYRNLTRLCSAPPGSTSNAVGTGCAATGGGPGTTTTTTSQIPQIFIQSFELQDRRAVDGQGPVAGDGVQDGNSASNGQQYNIITENDEDTFATLLLENISNISLEMIQRHQQKLLGTAGSSMTDGQLQTGASGASATCFQHVEGCSSMDRTDSKTSADGVVCGAMLDMRMDSTEEHGAGQREGSGRADYGNLRGSGTQDGIDEPLSDIPAGYRSLCYRTPSPKTRQIIRVDIVTSREKY